MSVCESACADISDGDLKCCGFSERSLVVANWRGETCLVERISADFGCGLQREEEVVEEVVEEVRVRWCMLKWSFLFSREEECGK